MNHEDQVKWEIPDAYTGGRSNSVARPPVFMTSISSVLTPFEGKIGSAARRVALNQDMEIGDGRAKLGDLVVVEVITVGNVSHELELATGRIITPRAGDVLIGVIGSSRAIARIIAPMPPDGFEIHHGVELDLLNRGAMIGKVVEQIQAGHLTKVRCLGVIKRDGRVVNLKDYCLPFPPQLTPLPPLLIVAGTEMEVGKTEVCCGLIAALNQRGLKVCGAKLTGVAGLRDILRLKDAGAFEVADFVDGGLVNTLTGDNVREATGVLLNYLASLQPNVIVVEIGGSISLGAQILLDYQELRKYFSGIILSAVDVTAAFGGVEALRRFHSLTTDAVGGPVANSEYYRDAVKRVTGVNACDFRHIGQCQAFINTMSARLCIG